MPKEATQWMNPPNKTPPQSLGGCSGRMGSAKRRPFAGGPPDPGIPTPQNNPFPNGARRRFGEEAENLRVRL